MKQIATAILILLISVPFGLYAQEKVIDKSGKRPKWVHGVEEDYIITSATGQTAEEAKDKALSDVKSKIVLSVAQVVSTSNDLSAEESNENGVYTFLETYSGSTQTTSADQAYLQGISLNKVEDYQWEKIRNKKTKKEWYVYNIKYPFSQFELRRLTDAFMLEDQKMTEKLNSIELAMETYDVDEMLSNLAQLRKMAKYFPDQRKDRATAMIAKINNQIKGIRIEGVNHKIGEMQYKLMMGDNQVTASAKPQISSNCARITKFTVSKDVFLVNYDITDCYDDSENKIVVSYKIGNSKITETFFFDISDVLVKFFVRDDIKISSNHVDLELICKQAGAFSIDKLELVYNNKIIKSLIGKQKIEVSGKGNHDITIPTQLLTNFEPNKNGKLSGKLYYTEEATGEQKVYKLLDVDYLTK